MWKSEIILKLQNSAQDFNSTVFIATQLFFGLCFDIEYLRKRFLSICLVTYLLKQCLSYLQRNLLNFCRCHNHMSYIMCFFLVKSISFFLEHPLHRWLPSYKWQICSLKQSWVNFLHWRSSSWAEVLGIGRGEQWVQCDYMQSENMSGK